METLELVYDSYSQSWTIQEVVGAQSGIQVVQKLLRTSIYSQQLLNQVPQCQHQNREITQPLQLLHLFENLHISMVPSKNLLLCSQIVCMSHQDHKAEHTSHPSHHLTVGQNHIETCHLEVKKWGTSDYELMKIL